MSENKNNNGSSEKKENEIVSMTVEECEIALADLENELNDFDSNKIPSVREYLEARITENDDPLLIDAAEIAVAQGKITTAVVQRRLNVGYGRGAKILDRLEELGIIDEPSGTKPRIVIGVFKKGVEDEPSLATESVFGDDEAFKSLDGEKGGDEAVFAFTLTDVPEGDVRAEYETEKNMTSAVEYVDEDELFVVAARLVVSEGFVSTSYLQRRLSIGYGRASMIIERLESLSIISPIDGNRGRRVIVSSEKLERILASL